MADTPQAATASAAQKDITKLRWREGKKAPEKMTREAAVVHGNTAYFNPGYSRNVYSYQITSAEEQWSRLPANPYQTFSLAVIDGLLTSVGGFKLGSGQANTLLSLTGEGGKRKWSEVFPPMPTAHGSTVAISTEQILVVAGGHYNRRCLNTVEMMNIGTKQWTTASPLPRKLDSLSGATCGDRLYLGGGYTRLLESSKSVLTCSLTDLLLPQSLEDLRPTLSLADKAGVRKEVCSLPVNRSTLTTLGGHLLAIGGEDDKHICTADVHRYDPHTDLWHVINNKRSECLAAVLPGDQLIVVGGYVGWGIKTGSVEIVE